MIIEDDKVVLELSLKERILAVTRRRKIILNLKDIREILPANSINILYKILGLSMPGTKARYGFFMTDRGLALCIAHDISSAVAFIVNNQDFDLIVTNIDELTLQEIVSKVGETQ